MFICMWVSTLRTIKAYKRRGAQLRNLFLRKDLSFSIWAWTSVCAEPWMCRIKDPLFLSVLVLPALVDNQRAPHSGEQLEKTLQEEADKKKMENMENICRERWKKTTTCDTFGGINTESKAECLIPEWLKGHRDPTRDSVCSEARVWGNTSQEEWCFCSSMQTYSHSVDVSATVCVILHIYKHAKWVLLNRAQI